MRRAKTIYEIYKEAVDLGCDCVFTNDPSLATALNSMTLTARVGTFAYTPKQIVQSDSTRFLKRRLLTDMEAILAVQNDIEQEFDVRYDMRFVYSEILNIREISKYTSKVRENLSSERARKVYDAYTKLDTKDRVMNVYDPSAVESFYRSKKKVAVVDIDDSFSLLNNMDKRLLPPIDKIEYIDPFTTGDYEIDTIYAAGNDRQVAASAVDLIDVKDAESFAIVIDGSSGIADALRGALYRKHIPFKNTMDVRDLTQVRDFLQFLSLAVDFDTIRVGDVRELFSSFHTGNYGALDPRWDNYLLSRARDLGISDETTRDLIKIMYDISNGGVTFGQAANVIMERRRDQKPQITMLLKDMDYLEKNIDRETLADLTYAVDSVEDLKHNEQTPENEKRGVLITDCRNSMYIDRSAVIYLGLDSSWDATFQGRAYVDPLTESAREDVRTEIMLQQGESRTYIVRPATGGEVTTPCRLLVEQETAEGKSDDATGFDRICRNYVVGTWHEDGEPAMPAITRVDVKPRTDWRFSKSRYDEYINCPKSYVLGSLIGREESDSTLFGECVHEFAEYYLCYPDDVKEKGLDHFLDELDNAYSGLSSECQEKFDRSELKISMANIMRFIDSVRPEDVHLVEVNNDRDKPNSLMRIEGKTMCSPLAEKMYDSLGDDPIKAKFDLMTGSLIVDYKTGHAKTATNILKAISRTPESFAEFQPLIYIAVLTSMNGGKDCEFRLFYTKANDIESCSEGYDITRNVRRIVYSNRTGEQIMMDPDYDYAANIKIKEEYRKFWPQIVDFALKNKDKDGWRDDKDVVRDMCVNILGKSDKPSNLKDAGAIIHKVADSFKNGIYAVGEGLLVITPEALERFLKDLKTDYKDACEIAVKPIDEVRRGSLKCDRCAYRSACMKERAAWEDDEDEA